MVRILTGLVVLGAMLTPMLSVAQEPDADTPSEPSPTVVREKTRLWVETLKTKSEEAADWEEAKRSMSDLNELRKKEIAQIDELIVAAGKRLEDAEKRKGELESESLSLRQGRDEMGAKVALLEEKIRKQIPMFPAVLREKVPDALARLQEPATDAPLQNRFRDVLLILGAANQFHHSITVASELRDFGGESVEVEILYLGFAGAWYVDRSGDRAGSGSVGEGGWVWDEDNGIANKVRSAIDMHRNEAAPGFVELPFQPGGGGS